ncbi:hypothetical protein Psi02_11640 [Planotetraspora silvatica]|uniref:Uncharacterized protein n=1 Tax=Planotetraspora silvatica TaxID=234614 RepID=A0A8J3UHL4_9ACTN|nr:hypothetical protein [Planotetraspora silvatica]GII44740.1 hypothetical protein Psi02_11640 [Planotetraspora silvatica]
MRLRRLLARVVAFAMLTGGLVVVAAAPAAAAPAGVIAEPSSDGALYTRAPITFGGTMSGATRMVVAVSDRVGKLWWHSDGTWGDYEGQDARLDGSGSWSFTWPNPEPGDYLVQAKATAADGSIDTALPYRRFTVVDLPATLGTPAGAVAEPTAGTVTRAGATMTMRGVGQASSGVTWAALTIFERDTGDFWHADGTWGAFEMLPVTIDSPGATRVTWRYDWTPPREGDYWVAIRTRDAQGVTAVSASVPLFTDATPPVVTVAAGQAAYPALHPITWTGAVTDNRGAASVRVAIMDRVSKLWWRNDGTWGDYQDRPATLTGPATGKSWTVSATGQMSFTGAGWSFSWVPPAPGSYGLAVLSNDASGRPDAAHPWVPFTVSPPAPDASPPTGAITDPAGGQGFASPDIRMRGTATDDVAVANVFAGVQDRDTGKWWQANGTWGGVKWFPATVTGETWSYDWHAPAAGHYVLAARIVDTAGKEVTRWQSFDHDPGTNGRYVTLLMSRSQWAATDGLCRPLRGAVPLDEAARQFKARGFAATGTVVVDRTLDQGRQCLSELVDYANWADLAGLRDTYGWTFVSHSMSYRDMTLLTPADQRAESCGSLTPLAAHGHTRAWGLFIYPNDKQTAQIQQDVVSTCFAFGRKYGTGLNTPPGTPGGLAAPYFQSTWSIPGGKCADQTLPCSRWVPSPNGVNDYAYASPDRLADFLKGYPGSWRSLQAYRFVRGTHIVNPGQGESWDCNGSDWRTHWTGSAEAYCLTDFLTALSAARGQATVADPATVAESWGRGALASVL